MSGPRVVELVGVPRPRAKGADPSLVLAQGWRVALVYEVFASGMPPGDDVAVVVFDRCCDHVFGGPNDEALHNHRLHACGLEPYCACEVLGSEWVEVGARIRHKNRAFIAGGSGSRHFVFAMEEGVFECLADGVEVVGVFEGREEAVRVAMRSVGLAG